MVCYHLSFHLLFHSPNLGCIRFKSDTGGQYHGVVIDPNWEVNAMTWYAQIYVGNGRPTGLIVSEETLDTSNEVLMRAYVPLEGNTEEEAWEDYESSTREDDHGFTQWA